MSQLNFLQLKKKLFGKYRETTKYPRSSVVARNFKRGGIISTLFQGYFFSAEQTEADLEKKKSSRGVRGMLPRKIFENLRAVMAILVLFE